MSIAADVREITGTISEENAQTCQGLRDAVHDCLVARALWEATGVVWDVGYRTAGPVNEPYDWLLDDTAHHLCRVFVAANHVIDPTLPPYDPALYVGRTFTVRRR